MSETQTAASTGRQLAPIEVFKGQLVRSGDEFRAALPSHIAPEKFQRVAVTAANTNPTLLSADRRSLLNACMKAAQDGLLPDGREASLVIYRVNTAARNAPPKWEDHVQYMPMVAGLLKKARNSGELRGIVTRCVYMNETKTLPGESKPRFKYWVDHEGEHIQHEPIVFGERGEMIGAYAVATLKDGTQQIAVLDLEKIRKHQRASKSKDKEGNPTGPWRDWFEEMAEKTAIRVLSKRLPASSDKDDLQRALEAEEAHYEYDRETGEVVEPAPAAQPAAAVGRRRPSRLDKVANAPEPAAPPVTDAEVEYPDEERDAIMGVEREAEAGASGAAPVEGDVI